MDEKSRVRGPQGPVIGPERSETSREDIWRCFRPRAASHEPSGRSEAWFSMDFDGFHLCQLYASTKGFLKDSLRREGRKTQNPGTRDPCRFFIFDEQWVTGPFLRVLSSPRGVFGLLVLDFRYSSPFSRNCSLKSRFFRKIPLL